MSRISKWVPVMLVAGLFYIPTGVSAQEIYTTKELTELPSIKSAQQAQLVLLESYPRNMQSLGVTGVVQVRFVIDADGKVVEDSVDVIASWSTLLGDAAARAVTAIEFAPGEKDGKAVSSVVMMPIRYTLE